MTLGYVLFHSSLLVYAGYMFRLEVFSSDIVIFVETKFSSGCHSIKHI